MNGSSQNSAIHAPRHWFIIVTGLVPLPLPGVFALFWLVLATFFMWLFGVFSPTVHDQVPGQAGVGFGLFFAFVNPYVIVSGAYVLRESRALLMDLRSSIECDDDTFAAMTQSIETMTVGSFIRTSFFGLSMGFVHLLLITGSPAELLHTFSQSLNGLGAVFGTLLTWFCINHLLAIFIRNAHVFARLGQDMVSIDVLNIHKLHPFGGVALLPTFSLLGAQLLYPIMLLGGEFNAAAMLPGFLLTTVILCFLFVRPAWPLHRRLLAAKTTAIRVVDEDIARWQIDGSSDLRELQPLLAYREYLYGLSEWPFQVSVLARWAVYLVIPPLTWILAALMEALVDSMIL
jgi:hypothetical protein